MLDKNAENITKKIEQLTPNNQSYVLNTIEALLYSQKIKNSKENNK